MKPLQHAQISAKTYGGHWQDYIEIHSFLDSSKAASAHFKHRFLLHHREGVELGVRIFGDGLTNSLGNVVETRRLLTDHLIEDVGKVVSVEDWAHDLLPSSGDSFYKFLSKKREQIEQNKVTGENELFQAFGLSSADIEKIKTFLRFPLCHSRHPAALLVSHNSFAVFLAENLFGHAFVKKNAAQANCYSSSRDAANNSRLIAVREVFERLIFLRLKAVFSPAEIIARTASRDWMRGENARHAQKEKKRLAANRNGI